MGDIKKVHDGVTPIVDKIYWGRSAAEAPEQLVIFCHGFRNNGRQMYEFASAWADALPNAAFVAPTAPFRRISGLWGLGKYLPVKFNGDGFVWYQINDTLISASVPGVGIAADILNQFIDSELRAFSLSMDACALVGFSQGGVIALSAGLRRPIAPKAIIAISGAMLDCDALSKEIANRSPVLLVHSKDDKIIPIEAAVKVEATLGDLGVPVKVIYRENTLHEQLDNFISVTCTNFLVQAFS